METIQISDEKETGRRTQLVGAGFALLPLLLGLMVGGAVGFGPCGPTIQPSARWVVIVAGCISLTSPIVAVWAFWKSFAEDRISTLVIGAPLLVLSTFICLYWFFIVASAL